MIVNLKYRRLIHYTLIVCTLCIQIFVFLFLYNDYFSGRKLDSIQEQLQQSYQLKKLTKESRQELNTAQEQLYQYSIERDKEELDHFFESLRKLTEKIKQIKIYEKTHLGTARTIEDAKKAALQLKELQQLIDEVFSTSQIKNPSTTEFSLKPFSIEKPQDQLKVEIRHAIDTNKKKKLLGRIKDAISGKTEPHRDTVFITKTLETTVDTSKVKTTMDSTVQAINNYYKSEIDQYQSNLSSQKIERKNMLKIYHHLILRSNDLMKVYDAAVDANTADLQKQFNEQNSINAKIRKNVILGLMTLMFFVLAILVYYTWLSFSYEKELKEAHQEVQNNLNFKNRVLGVLSHEIRGPLKIINLFIRRIGKRIQDPEILDFLKSISFTNNSMLIQANQILEYTKNQDKKLMLQSVEFNLQEEINAILNIFHPFIESRNNIFVVENRIAAELYVNADRTKIHQLFMNILGNANKFTENGTIKVFIEANSISDQDVELQVMIEDTGIGISKEDIIKIFQPYYQGVVSAKVENIGVGLGLNLCKEIVQLFNGSINVKSEIGQGTSIKFNIILHRTNEL